MVLPRRKIFALGFLLMVINRLCAFVLPLSTKPLIDRVINHNQLQLLTPLVSAVLGATLIQGITSFSLTQLLSKSAQRLISELRQKVQRHIGLLSVSYYDANKSGALVSRIMSDVEGVRNLVGTGLVDFAEASSPRLSLSDFCCSPISSSDDRPGRVFQLALSLTLKKAFTTNYPPHFR